MHVNKHFTISTYYRLFLPQILPSYNKIIFLDSDTVVLAELSELFHIDLEDSILGATTDTALNGILHSEIKNGRLDWVHYIKDTLGLPDPYSYFQAGVLLLDLKGMRDKDFLGKSLRIIQDIKKPRYLDQCILNSTVQKYGFRIKKIEVKWNLGWHVMATNNPHPFSDIPEKFEIEYKQALDDLKIIHYASNIKPWDEPQFPLAKYFWLYARETVFYEQIIYSSFLRFTRKNSSEVNKEISKFLLKEKKRKFKLYSFLSMIFFFPGAKEKFKKKREKLKEEIEKIEKYLYL